MRSFDYNTAFSRNIGWVTENEQERLRNCRVAIGGLGGVGGVHLLTLARLGIGKFNVADFDTFDFVNFNRQVGATMSSIDRPKIEVLVDMARDINPEIELCLFPEGISTKNIDEFLDGVDVYVDGLDFFAFDIRRKTFATCRAKGIPVVTAAPLGLGTAILVFSPTGMSCEDYFGFEGCDEFEMAIRFLVGLSPAILQRGYVADMSRVSLHERRGPSSIASCQLCAGVAAVETLKLLLGRGKIRYAPWGSQFDAYRMKYVRTWRPGGHKNPLQRLMFFLLRQQLRYR
ncbi:MAG: ThiF family adenylyltransferase [Gammaproteobacteria bacterium]|nr:ThiF family adenylyltransferase [Gammaproteobacteria bacterium]MBU2435817.1 ThiF family adenylyltransferase [Gammaproteobacteria bacterium]MBU2449402.1 ThiF family adenylyltransferase [Gammaproteobacteria bacterium]